VAELLDQVGLSARDADRALHELSGGQRQRVVVARARVLSPKLLICDERVASLDVSIQAQMINLLRDLQAGLGPICLFISHDLSLVRHLCDHVAVLRDGQIVEQGPVGQVYDNPVYPHIRELVAAVPGRARVS
jgi:ABC-type oligopeptide transport system ATPase subunit